MVVCPGLLFHQEECCRVYEDLLGQANKRMECLFIEARGCRGLFRGNHCLAAGVKSSSESRANGNLRCGVKVSEARGDNVAFINP